jgi:hypothetical protein
MAALVWLRRNDPEFTDAEFIVRAARPTRWNRARFNAGDVERAARAISSDPYYLKEVALDAKVTARGAGVGVLDVTRAVKHIASAVKDDDR